MTPCSPDLCHHTLHLTFFEFWPLAAHTSCVGTGVRRVEVTHGARVRHVAGAVLRSTVVVHPTAPPRSRAAVHSAGVQWHQASRENAGCGAQHDDMLAAGNPLPRPGADEVPDDDPVAGACSPAACDAEDPASERKKLDITGVRQY